ncbi:hypothetical protein JTE90_024698 [Oedothorax gibbosus]|uniref:Uncharacterized protein n=1 Tax=Oedothorax gibbosus TaxID=931172 RepID=A0AAV6U9Z4_9ARAC|nr:hypothetical protein JTE90_024698 [Oedothorax gibbosus]
MPNPIDYTEISNAQIDDIELKQLIENSEVLQFQKINLLDGKEPVYCDVSTGTARPYIPQPFRKAELFRHLPQQRKLPPEVREQAKVLLDLDVNKKLLQQKLQRDTGKIVTLKDLSNLAAQDKRSNDLGEAVTLLQDKYDRKHRFGASGGGGGWDDVTEMPMTSRKC